ncbi:MAG TPA: hypothetical protein VHZ26_08980 [Caulobacteraceae bacterium]|jgi:hypothetical protein|nr:hypothetical protein [Caulobacteraceae bacterium]
MNTHRSLTCSTTRPLVRSDAWTEAQDEVLYHHPHWPDRTAAEAASGLGPPRTASAVSSRRRALGLCRHPGGEGAIVDRETADADDDGPEADEGWPELPGAPEQRDADFVRALLQAQLSAVRALKAGRAS